MVRESREALGWSQAKLAREAGVNAETVRMLEDGATAPKSATLNKIRRALKPRIRKSFEAEPKEVEVE
jgi:ribosome-binding protein aMBF1 (putative translation factor)